MQNSDKRLSVITHNLFLGFIGALIGVSSWGNIGLFACLLVFGAGYGLASNKMARALFVFGYFLGGSWTLISVFNAFWPADAPFLGYMAWPGVALLLSAPWWIIGAFGDEKPRNISIRLGFSLLLTSIPPLSAWSIMSPLCMAGSYFPGTGLAGLLLSIFTLMMMAALFSSKCNHGTRNSEYDRNYQPSGYKQRLQKWKDNKKWLVLTGGLLALLAVSFALNVTYAPPAMPSNVRGVSLGWRPLPTNVTFWKNVDRQNKIYKWLKKYLKTIPDHQTVLLPENLEGFYFKNFYSQGVMDSIERVSKKHDDTVLIGADDIATHHGRAWTYMDALNTYGMHHGIFPSRQPVPLGEWKPWERGSADAFWWSFGPDRLGKTPFAMAVCYSQLLVWPLATYFMDTNVQPEWILAPANHDWEKTPDENNIQHKALMDWGRLYGLPIIQANDIH